MVTLAPPFGYYVRFVYSTLELVVDARKREFFPQENSYNPLGALGWDHNLADMQYWRSSNLSARGVSFHVGPAHKFPYAIEGHFQLTEDKYRILEAMSLLQQETIANDILVFDHRLMVSEGGVRSRSRFDPANTTAYSVSGVHQYWPIFRAEITELKLVTMWEWFDVPLYHCTVKLMERLPGLGSAGDSNWVLS